MNYDKIIEKISKEKGLSSGKLINKKGEKCAVGCLIPEDTEVTCPSVTDSDRIYQSIKRYGNLKDLYWLENLNDRIFSSYIGVGASLIGTKDEQVQRKKIVVACLYARKEAEINGEKVNRWSPGRFCTINSSMKKREEEGIWFKNFVMSIIYEK